MQMPNATSLSIPPSDPSISMGAALSVAGNICISLGFQFQRLANDPRRRIITHHLLWWCGAALMALGECGNFTAYGMAPVSLIAPLDSVVIVSNVLLSRLLFREKISRAGVACVALMTMGTVTTALNAPKFEGNSMEKSYVFECILSHRAAAFLSMTCIAVLFVANPAEWSHVGVSSQAKRLNPFYYCFLCGSTGTLAAISAKGISTAMGNVILNRNTDMFSNPSIAWLTYALFASISISIALQMKYSHIAFNGFGSSLVLSVYYIVFTIITVLAGAIIFQETMFERYAPVFFAGLVLTYLGVFTLSRDDISLYMRTDFDHRHLTRVVVD